MLAAAMLVIAVLALGAHWIGTGLTCAWDTSNCVSSTEKNGVYEGTLSTLDGDPYRSSDFEVEFESREREPVAFRTDERGRFCIRWTNEDSVPLVTTPGGEPLSARDEATGDGLLIPGLSGWRNLEGRDPPPGCEESDEGIPWNRAEDAESSWQYRLLVLLPLGAIAALAAALIGRRNRYAFGLFVAGAILLVANLAAGAILWG